MKTSTKYILGGIALIATGGILLARAKKLTIIKHGQELPNEGGYIRSNVVASLAIVVGLSLSLSGVYKAGIAKGITI